GDWSAGSGPYECDSAGCDGGFCYQNVCTPLTVTTFTGNGGDAGQNGTGGRAGTTQIGTLAQLACDDDAGVAYYFDSSDCRIHKADQNGNTTTLSGSGSCVSADGTASTAGFHRFTFAMAAFNGNVYLAELNPYRIRKIDSNGNATVLAGNGTNG